MYTFAHPIEDALEQITHSVCTLEFEDQRPFYDWLLARLTEGGLLKAPPPRQYEFARLNVSHVITSKRKLRQLVEEGHVSGWDDPRMPTLAGLRRRGYTPESLRLFAERSGVTKSGGWTDYAALDAALRETLDPQAPRAMAVLDPVALHIDNWAEVFGSADHLEPCQAPAHPHLPDLGQRQFMLGERIWIERSDYEAQPPKGFFRLYPGNKVRLKYGYVIECTGADSDEQGRVTQVHARLLPDTKSGTPGEDSVKVMRLLEEGQKRPWPAPSPKTATSSSATAFSWPISASTFPAKPWFSTASRVCAIRGANKYPALNPSFSAPHENQVMKT